MPLFEYRCSECAHLEEVLQKHGEPPPAECPKCHKAGTFAKELSLTSFQLKGGGWYKDLYASAKPADSAASTPGSTATPSSAPASTSTATKESSGSSSSGAAGGGSSGGSSGGGSSGGQSASSAAAST